MLIYSVLRKVRNCATKQKMWQVISIIFRVLTENFYIVPFPCKFRFSFGGKFEFTKETLNNKKTRPLIFISIFLKLATLNDIFQVSPYFPHYTTTSNVEFSVQRLLCFRKNKKYFSFSQKNMFFSVPILLLVCYNYVFNVLLKILLFL